MDTKRSLEDAFVGAVTVGERGQVVIPAEARKKLDIHTGDRLFVMAHPDRGGMMLLKIDSMREFLNHMATNLSMVEADIQTPSEESGKPGPNSREK